MIAYGDRNIRGQSLNIQITWQHVILRVLRTAASIFGGGMLASDNKELIDHAHKLPQQAGEDFPNYEHEEIGYNYRMNNMGLGDILK